MGIQAGIQASIHVGIQVGIQAGIQEGIQALVLGLVGWLFLIDHKGLVVDESPSPSVSCESSLPDRFEIFCFESSFDIAIR